MDRLILGDNQFFGVNHMSEEKARAQSMRFRDLESIMEVLGAAYEERVRSFMCTTHDRVAAICDRVRADPDRYGEFVFLPCMPYAHKYANALSDTGPIQAVARFLPNEGLLDAVARGGRSLAKKDIEGIATLLVDAEMKAFRELSTPIVFLQNVVVDMMLGLNLRDAFPIFADHVKSRYGAEPGFITMNLPRLLTLLKEVGIENPIVCSNINKIGFRMCGGTEAYTEALRAGDCRAIAMSVFASGAIPSVEAIEWVCAQPNIASIVFGASSRSNIRQTRDLVATGWPRPEDP